MSRRAARLLWACTGSSISPSPLAVGAQREERADHETSEEALRRFRWNSSRGRDGQRRLGLRAWRPTARDARRAARRRSDGPGAGRTDSIREPRRRGTVGCSRSSRGDLYRTGSGRHGWTGLVAGRRPGGVQSSVLSSSPAGASVTRGRHAAGYRRTDACCADASCRGTNCRPGAGCRHRSADRPVPRRAGDRYAVLVGDDRDGRLRWRPGAGPAGHRGGRHGGGGNDPPAAKPPAGDRHQLTGLARAGPGPGPALLGTTTVIIPCRLPSA